MNVEVSSAPNSHKQATAHAIFHLCGETRIRTGNEYGKMRAGEREEEEKVKEIGFARNARMRTAERTQVIGSNVCR